MDIRQDWEPVVIRKGGGGGGKKAVTQDMIARGQTETQMKYNAGTNKKRGTDMNTKALDEDNETLAVPKVEMAMSKKIQQGRMAKKMTQKDLANRINEKASVVNDYEAGRAIPNQQIISKLERVLGIKLREKKKGGKK